MKKRLVKLFTFLMCIVVTLLTCPLIVKAEEGYTYNYDWWEDVQYSPDAYEVVDVFTGVELGLEKAFSNPKGLYVKGNMVYICDTGNNRIIELERLDVRHLEVKRIIDKIKGSDIETLNGPTDIAISEDGDIFIADQNNGRIVKVDNDLNYLLSFTKPTDATFDQSLDFLPSKLTVDTAGRVYCIATNVNKGLIKYESDGKFSGFVGATPVSYDFMDYIWKKFATKAQRAQMENFVPTEYDNVYMDKDGFIYACTTTFSTADLRQGKVDPVRRLNLMGNDTLIRNGNFKIIGDVEWSDGGGYVGPSLLTDVTAYENDCYAVLDKTRGRIFAYDDQGRLLYGFGGKGNIDGYFKQPVAFDHMGHDLIVLDSLDCSITLFTTTEYGENIFQAIEQFKDGQYDESGKTWQKVMDKNGNYDLAYIGIGRALMMQKNYKESLEYFKLKWDDDNYSMAFKEYRKQWVEEHILIIVIAFFAVLIIPIAVGKVKKIKWEIDTADIFKYKNFEQKK